MTITLEDKARKIRAIITETPGHHTRKLAVLWEAHYLLEHGFDIVSVMDHNLEVEDDG